MPRALAILPVVVVLEHAAAHHGVLVGEESEGWRNSAVAEQFGVDEVGTGSHDECHVGSAHSAIGAVVIVDGVDR